MNQTQGPIGSKEKDDTRNQEAEVFNINAKKPNSVVGKGEMVAIVQSFSFPVDDASQPSDVYGLRRSP